VCCEGRGKGGKRRVEKERWVGREKEKGRLGTEEGGRREREEEEVLDKSMGGACREKRIRMELLMSSVPSEKGGIRRRGIRRRETGGLRVG